jgi:O-antigen ligase
MIFAMTTTYSRSAFFGLLIGTGLWILLRIFSKEPFPTRSILLLLIGSFSIVGFLFQEQIIQRGGMVNSNKFSEDSDNVRLSYQLLAFRMISDNPLTGVGYGQFNIHSPKYMAPNQNPAMNRSATHNIYLLLASETGLLSLFAYLSFIGLLLWKSIRSPQTPLISILTAIFFAFLFIGGCDFYLLLFQQGRIMFFLVTGLLASQFWLEKRSPNLSGLPSLQGQ